MFWCERTRNGHVKNEIVRRLRALVTLIQSGVVRVHATEHQSTFAGPSIGRHRNPPREAGVDLVTVENRQRNHGSIVMQDTPSDVPGRVRATYEDQIGPGREFYVTREVGCDNALRY